MPQQSLTSSARPRRIPDPQYFQRGCRWFGRVLIFFLTAQNRRRALRSERKHLPAWESAITTLREETQKSRENGLVDRARVLNVGLYLLVMDRDFSVLKLDMVSTF